MSDARWYFTEPEGIPFVVTDFELGSMRCRIPVLPDGDGADTEPLERRTARCTHRANRFVGAAPTCAHHLAIAMRIGGITPRESVGECPA